MLLIRKCLLRNGTEAVPYKEKSGATADAIAPPRVTLSRYVQLELNLLTWQPAKRRTER